MNGTCINRFAHWFAYHLSNFQFRWGWDDWSISLKYENLHPKPKFIAETLGYCMRLSYHLKILESIPQNFHKLAPIQPAPKNKFITEENGSSINEEIVGSNNVSAIMTSLNLRCTPEEVLLLLNEIPNPNDVDEGNLW